MLSTEPTLNEVLAHLGLTAHHLNPYRAKILRDGKVVFTGTCSGVWAWLSESGLYAAVAS